MREEEAEIPSSYKQSPTVGIMREDESESPSNYK